MLDILTTKAGDIVVSDLGDISLTYSVRQTVRVHLRWFFGEWRLGPQLGFPWFEEIFVKNPNIEKIKTLIRDEILSIDEVDDVDVTSVIYDPAGRNFTCRYECYVGEDVFREELKIHA